MATFKKHFLGHQKKKTIYLLNVKKVIQITQFEDLPSQKKQKFCCCYGLVYFVLFNLSVRIRGSGSYFQKFRHRLVQD